VAGSQCVGTWYHPGFQYTVGRINDGLLTFQQTLPNRRTALSTLRSRGEWFEGEVFLDGGTEHSGTLRLRPGDEPRTLISNFRAALILQVSLGIGCGALISGEDDWGPDLVATCLRPQDDVYSLHADAAIATAPGSFADVAQKLSEGLQGCVQGVEVPVKNTFIQFELPKQLVRSNSAPDALMSGPFHLKQRAAQQQAHIQGVCRPCAYFWRKDDGCRRGSECSTFCHLCQPSELKRRRKAKDKALRLQSLFARLALG